MPENVTALHNEAIIIDAVAPLLQEKRYLDWYRQGGVTAVCPTVGGYAEWAAGSAESVGAWLRHVRENAENLRIVHTTQDIIAAKQAGQLALILHFQGTKPIEDRIDLVDAYAAMGLRIVQLCYNRKNLVGDGAEEQVDSGLSHFGRRVVTRLNENRVAVDCAHTGVRTTRDAVEHSAAPVIITHANARGVHDTARNVPDEIIKAIAGRGGVIGTVGFPAFLGTATQPSLDCFIDDIAYKADLVGVDHVGLGIDYYLGQHPVADASVARARWEKRVADGDWRPDTYPAPPHHYPEGIETPQSLPNLTARLLERGFSRDDVLKILGGNWMRILGEIWGG